MATKIRAHNLHTDVKTILDSKADISALAGPLRLADSRSIILGADSDLTITHDGTNNIINSRGSGDLFIQNSGANKLVVDDSGITVTGAIRSADSGTPTIYSNSDIIFNVGLGNGVINSGGSKITNLGNPVNPQDAAPKSYVDSVNYTDSAVDTHLNTDSATAGEVLSWNGTDYNWTSQSGGGAASGDIIANNLSVDSDIKLTNGTGSIKTIRPAGTSIDPNTNMPYNYSEHTWYEQKVYNESMSGILFAMQEMGGFPGFDTSPVTLYQNTPMLMSAEITIHIVAYWENYFGAEYGTEFEDSQIIQGHLMHNYTTATFTETSNTCSNPGSNLITLTTEIDSDSVSLKMFPTQAKFTTVTINSRSAMTKIPGLT